MNTRAEVQSPTRDAWGVASALLQLTKPGVTRLVMVTTLFGAAMVEGSMDLAVAALTMLGTVLVVGSANTLNMVIEHEVDGLMERTRDRPLPAGRLTRDVALAFGVVLGAAGLLTLVLTVNALTAALGALALAMYVLIYTPMKAKSSLALYVGAVPGALPPVLGYTGLSGTLTAQACAIFLVLFVWQVPHFLAITVFRRNEYAAAGLQVMSVEHGVDATKRAIAISAALLLAVSILPWAVGLGGLVYLIPVGCAGVAFTLLAAVGPRGGSADKWARSVFFASLPYLVLVFTLLGVTAP